MTLLDPTGEPPRVLHEGRLEGSAEEVRAALGGLEAALVEATADPALRLLDGYSTVRLVFEVDPLVPWEQVEWVMGSASSRTARLWRMRFLTGTPEPAVDIDLPKDRSIPDDERGVFLMLDVKLRHLDSAGSGSRRTRVTLACAYAELGAESLLPVGDADETTFDACGEFTLPSHAEPSDAVASVWQRIEDVLRARIRDADRPLGFIVTPPIRGGQLPFRDVLSAMLLLRRVGVERLRLDGGPGRPLTAADFGGR